MPWTPDLSVGVEMIDEQHKMLFEKVDKLFEAGKNKQEKEYISKLLDFLDAYTKKHFSDEERYMLSIRYPGYTAQKKAHEDFIRKLAKLKSDYQSSGGSLLVILNTNQILLDWLINHVSHMDKRIGEFVRNGK